MKIVLINLSVQVSQCKILSRGIFISISLSCGLTRTTQRDFNIHSPSFTVLPNKGITPIGFASYVVNKIVFYYHWRNLTDMLNRIIALYCVTSLEHDITKVKN